MRLKRLIRYFVVNVAWRGGVTRLMIYKGAAHCFGMNWIVLLEYSNQNFKDFLTDSKSHHVINIQRVQRVFYISHEFSLHIVGVFFQSPAWYSVFSVAEHGI